MKLVRGGTEFAKDGNEDLVGQTVDGGDAKVDLEGAVGVGLRIVVIVNLHVLDIGNAKRRLGVICDEKEVGLLVVVGGRRVGGRRGSRFLHGDGDWKIRRRGALGRHDVERWGLLSPVGAASRGRAAGMERRHSDDGQQRQEVMLSCRG